MYPVHDDDAALLLSLTVAAKRRPAALDEIFTALAMAKQGEIPDKSKLVDAFAHMGVCGLIAEAEVSTALGVLPLWMAEILFDGICMLE